MQSIDNRQRTMVKNTYKEKNSPKKAYHYFSMPALKDKRLSITLGFVLQGTALFLFIAFTSHFFNGKIDQCIIESIREVGLKSSGLEINNWLGILGATSAYYFIFRWFGITAFFIPSLMYLIGHKLVYKKVGINLYKAFIFSIFSIFWISLALGYVDLTLQDTDFFDNVLGGIGFELALLFNSLLGWGTLIFLLTSLIVFLVSFFNITSLAFLAKLVKLPSRKPTDDLRLPIDLNKAPSFTEPHQPANKARVDLPIEIVQNAHSEEETQQASTETHGPSLRVEQQKVGEKFTENIDDYDPKIDLSRYQYPTIDLLDRHDHQKVQVTKAELAQNKDKIVETLTNFKIGISSIKATIGPTVTLYEIIPEAGVKISKIKNLEDDIALSLAALGIRIIAPIPGKGTIGIEVPNKHREVVPLRSILATDKFVRSYMELPIVMGKTISNEVFLADLARMPHLLIAGATGQGKSVGLNVVLASLIYKKHPSQLKFILVDPKKVELSLYNKLERHFLAKLPSNEEAIITETKKVIHTLNSLCLEMDCRYELLKEAGTRNIKEYNEKFVRRRLNPAQGHRFLPYIVLVIDEFADMMMTAGKEIEMPIARLAQLARAIGIHLVLATQRPSVNVITGIIKANFPVRISFRVTSKVDSRTILDTGGAEQLVGQGDMLLSMNSEITRLQCPFLDTEEAERVCDYIGTQRGYESAYLLPAYEEEYGENEKGDIALGERDAFFEEAARLIVAHQQGSTSLIQRKLKLGYNRAGRLIDQLEAAGIVGPFEGSKAREVLVPDEYSLEQLLNSLNDHNKSLTSL